MDEAPPRVRHGQWLVGPLVTLATVAALLAVARGYDRIPVHPPACGFRTHLGIPCAGCGGTRAMRALAGGRLVEAARFNPAVVLGVLMSGLWAVSGWTRYRNGVVPPPHPEQNRRIVRNAIVAGAALVLNWIYLILYLPA